MIRILLALGAGVLNALAFAPFNWWPLGLASFAVLFSVWLFSSPRLGFWSGLAFGLGQFGLGVSWMYVSLNTYGGMPPVMAGFSIFLVIAMLSLYPAFCGLLQSLVRNWHPTVRVAIIMPCLWILFEWLRLHLFTGFPFLLAGYAYLDTPLSNYAPIGGTLLVGFIALMSVGALVAVGRNVALGNGLLAGLLIAAWIGGWQLNETSWTRAVDRPITVSIVQNNIPLAAKWDADYASRIIARYMEKSLPLTDSDLIVWPEAAVPDYLDNLSNDFWRDVEQHPADFVFGVLHRDTKDAQSRYYNSVVAVTDRIMIYRKQHLVPFGEYFPLQWLLNPLIRMLDIPMSDFSAWTRPQRPLEAADQRFAMSICYEDAFPADMRSQIPDAGVLINVSEDIWFGNSFAPHQRLQMARFRARESERPMIRSSNNGLSSLINWKGGIDRRAPQFAEAVVSGSVQPRSGVTPYVAFGDSPVLSLAALILLLGIIFGRPRKADRAE